MTLYEALNRGAVRKLDDWLVYHEGTLRVIESQASQRTSAYVCNILNAHEASYGRPQSYKFTNKSLVTIRPWRNE